MDCAKKNKFLPVLGMLFTLISSSCSMLSQKRQFEKPALAPAELEQMTAAQELYNQREFAESETAFHKFADAHLGSGYYYLAQINEAKSQIAQRKFPEAAEILKKVIEATHGRSDDLEALALYEVSFCYEAMDDDLLAYASLQDADKLKSHLPPEIAQAELPARMAGNLFRRGMTLQAQNKMREADQGIEKLMSVKTNAGNANMMARIYYSMGMPAYGQVTLENFNAVVDTLQVVQVYLLKSVQVGDPTWSPVASELIVQSYQNLVNLMDKVSLNSAREQGAARRERAERRYQMAGRLSESIEKLKALRLEKDSESELVSKVFEKLQDSDLTITKVLTESPVQNELTSDSEPKTTEKAETHDSK